jgi:hypothetical protein
MSDPMIYRRSALGSALTDSLDELIQSGLLDPPLAMKILSQFDTSISDSLKSNVKAKGSFKGHLGTLCGALSLSFPLIYLWMFIGSVRMCGYAARRVWGSNNKYYG